ncbi:MAG: polysaccharide biosynthesis/export family protein [Rhodobacteraceae bacterium]|nr:polysaccharide biosynthesis/export family protein [Paracoccaceae bacterium]
MKKTLIAASAALALLATGALAQSYGIKPGDKLQLEVLEDPSLNRTLLVLPDGTVSVPFAGTVNAQGRTVAEIQAAITAALAPNFATTPTVSVSVGELGQRAAGTAAGGTGGLIPVYAIGEVATPGKIDVRKGTTLLQFLAQSGGLSKFAATSRIQLRRVDPKTGQETVYKFNYKAVQDGGSAPTIVLRPGDVIVVPERRLFE